MEKDKLIKLCERTIEWCFYALIFVSAFSTSLVEISTGLMILAWIVKVLLTKDLRWMRFVPTRIIFALWVWTLLSFLNTSFMDESVRGILKVVKYSLVFIVMASRKWEDSEVRKFLAVSLFSLVMVSVNGFYQYFAGEGFIRHRTLINLDYMKRISSSFVHPNDFGAYLLSLGAIILAAFIANKVRLRERAGVVVVFMVSMVSLFLTKSRGAWISFFCAILALGALKGRKALAALAVVLIVFFILLPPVMKDRLMDLSFSEGNTTWERLKLWEGTVNMIKMHPILGFGVNTYSRNFPLYRPEGYLDVRYAHNSYLQMASEIGIVGAGLFIAFIFSVLWHSLKGIPRIGSFPRQDIARGVFAAASGFAINSAVDTHLYSVSLAVLFHLLMGFCFSLAYYGKKD